MKVGRMYGLELNVKNTLLLSVGSSAANLYDPTGEPIKKVEQYLLKNWPEDFHVFRDKNVKDLNYEIEDAFNFAENSPFPKNSDAFEGEYA